MEKTGRNRDTNSLPDSIEFQNGESGRLNPQFCEWLMGWPQDHTDLKPLGTDRCHCAQPLHGNCSLKDFNCWRRYFMQQLETFL
jgi:hypothetical protein